MTFKINKRDSVNIQSIPSPEAPPLTAISETVIKKPVYCPRLELDGYLQYLKSAYIRAR